MFSTNFTWLPGQRSLSKVIHHDVTERNWLLGAVNQFKLCVCVDVWEPLLGWNRDTGNWQYDAVWTAVSAQTGSTSQVWLSPNFFSEHWDTGPCLLCTSLFESLDPFFKFCASTCFVLWSSVCVRVSNFFIYCLSFGVVVSSCSNLANVEISLLLRSLLHAWSGFLWLLR